MWGVTRSREPKRRLLRGPTLVQPGRRFAHIAVEAMPRRGEIGGMATVLSFPIRKSDGERTPSRIRRAPAVLLPAGDGRLHAKLYHRLRELIESGSWSPGTRVPSSRVLAEDLGVSRNTASIALEHLVAEGWAEARSRSGIFVSRRLPVARPVVSPRPEPVRSIPDVPVDLFPLRHWRSIQAHLWATHGHALLEAAPLEGEPGLRESLSRLVCPARGFTAEADDIVIAADAARALAAIVAELNGTGVETVTADAATGTAPIAASARRALLQWAAAGDRWIVERDCGGWVADTAGRPVPPLRADPAGARVIHVRDFADMLFPGLPLCFIVAPREIAERVRSALARQTYRPSRADQLAFQAFVDQGYLAAHLRRLKRALPERREALVRLLRRYAGSEARVESMLLPCHVRVQPLGCDAESLAIRLRQVGLPVQRVADRLLVGFGGLTDSALRQIEAGLQGLSRSF
jgi:GntR family transcriptional regulator/MocR family aminotransferase